MFKCNQNVTKVFCILYAKSKAVIHFILAQFSVLSGHTAPHMVLFLTRYKCMPYLVWVDQYTVIIIGRNQNMT